MNTKTRTFTVADILLPKSADMSKWAVVACDQFTSQPEYWQQVKDLTGGAPSAFELILPEAYLESADVDERIGNIHKNMEDYLARSIFEEYKNSLVYLERTDSTGKLRQGLVGAVDLEMYDFRGGSITPVRATEATVAERIPPRLKVRRGAPLELPHIMILIDDPDFSVIEPISEKKGSLSKVYDFELMQRGGRAAGYILDGAAAEETLTALDKLSERLSAQSPHPLIFAMGDGNHSLATAKEYYEELKRQNPGKDMSGHPARYALAEIVNLHSSALEFEAIHRIVTEINPDELLNEMTKVLSLSTDPHPDKQAFEWICGGVSRKYFINAPDSNLIVGSVQNFLDKYLRDKGGKIDYIHGEDVVRRLAAGENSVGILLPDMAKAELFPTVTKDGALPRKTFSMGHAEDKRYYIEARRIK
ncbi:MAG: DUF1015 domain-containing protein [Oscillospiraceae bacterium]|nr:DUF1015 domain-containing protein [Oscillospiraceae bacterium]